MSDSITRRTVALTQKSKIDLDVLKTETGMATDNAVINDAIQFRARFADRDPTEVKIALSFWDKVSKEVSSGGSCMIERQDQQVRKELFVPSLV